MMSVMSVVCCAGRGRCDGPDSFPPGEFHRMCVSVFVCACVCVIECAQMQQ